MKNSFTHIIVKSVRSAAILIAALVMAVPASAQDIPDTDGIFAKKYISSFDYDNMAGTLTLETFVTGEMKLVSEPFDVVMVLDRSTSMNGDPLTNMKTAACSVVDKIKEVNGEDGQSKLGVVVFGRDASNVCNLGVVNESTAESFKSNINNISTDGNTNMRFGLQNAYNMLKDVDSERKKFVIFFTDGKPGSNNYDQDSINEAKYAVERAYQLKSANIELYTIGLFDSDPDKKYINTSSKKPTGTGNVSIKSFLEHISSLYPGITSLDYEPVTEDVYDEVECKWKGDLNPISTDTQYYRWAQTSGALDDIFKDIVSQIIGVASKSLTAETVIKDIISADCTLPDGVKVEDVKVYSATCNGGDKTDGFTFGAKSDQSADVEIIVDENTVNVTDFDFGANWVGYDSSASAFHGKKLIIEIPFKVKPGALANKDIRQLETNGEDSGVYENPDAETPIVRFTVPSVSFIDVTIKATGLHAGESAIFKVERKMAGESEFSYFTTIALTGTSDEGTEISSTILYQDPEGEYKVTDISGWSWTYTIQGEASQTKTSEEGQPIVFEFSNTKKESITIQNAEKSKDNRFTTYMPDGITVNGNWMSKEKEL